MFRKRFLALPVVASLLLAAAPAFAHEQQVFRIGDKDYKFVVGSLNEPVFVDDKSGVELQVSRIDDAAHAAMKKDDHADPAASAAHHEEGMPVAGLEESLRVELIAGDKKRVMDLATVLGTAGAYKAPFYPTVATTLTYRVFGDLEGVPVDLSFTCNPAGHPQAPEDKTEMKVGEGVTRTFKTGAFGCPRPKSEAGFPEAVPTLRELSAAAATPPAPSTALPTALGLLGVVLGTVAIMKKK